MSFAFAQHLEDFGQPKGLAPVSMFETSQPTVVTTEHEPEVDIEAIKSDSYQEGYKAAIAELEAQHKAAEEALRAVHAQELAALDAQLGDKMAQQIAEKAKQQIDANCEMMSHQVGQILTQVVSSELVTQSISQLKELILGAFADDETAQIRIDGPKALVEKLQEAVGEHFANIDAHTNENIELSLEVDQALMVTRLHEWRQIFGDNS